MIVSLGTSAYLRMTGYSPADISHEKSIQLFIKLAELDVRNGLLGYEEFNEYEPRTQLKNGILASIGLNILIARQIDILSTEQLGRKIKFIPGDLVYTYTNPENRLYCVMNPKPYLKHYQDYYINEGSIYPMVCEDMRFNVLQAVKEIGIWSYLSNNS